MILESTQQSFQRKNIFKQVSQTNILVILQELDFPSLYYTIGLSNILDFWFKGIIHNLEYQWGRGFLSTALKLVFQNRSLQAYPRIEVSFPNEIRLRIFFYKTVAQDIERSGFLCNIDEQIAAF